MKLIYLHQYFRKPSMSGGIRSYEFAKRLSKSGIEVVVVSSDTQNKFKGWRVEKLDGFEVHWISVPYDNKFSIIRRLWSFIKFLTFSSIYICKIPSDKLFASSTPLTVAIPALIYRFVKRNPYVFEVRDVWPEVPIALGIIKNRFFVKTTYILEGLVYKYAEHIVTLSPDMEKSISKRSDKTDISVIPNAADRYLFSNQPSPGLFFDLVKKISESHQKVIFYTGALGLVNNLKSFIKLSSFSCGDIGFVIIGQGKEEDELKSFAKELGVFNTKLYFLPTVTKSQLTAVHHFFDMAASTVLPINELYANSANKVFDAFASGIPILINHGGWIKDIIEKHECGVVMENSPDLEDYIKVRDFLFDERKYINACHSSKLLGENEFDRDKLYHRLYDVINYR